MLTIGRVARSVGVRASAIRYYETQGILRPTLRAANGYRFYSDDAIKLLLFVKRAQSLGITLKEIKPLLNLASRGQQPCNHVKQVAKQHLNEVSRKIHELELLRTELRTLLRRKAGRPHANEVCPIIERGMANLGKKNRHCNQRLRLGRLQEGIECSVHRSVLGETSSERAGLELCSQKSVL